jgi:hypothetical protein
MPRRVCRGRGGQRTGRGGERNGRGGERNGRGGGMDDRIDVNGNNMDSNSLLELGLSLVGFSCDRQKVAEKLNLRRFRSFFGVGPKALAALYSDLQQTPQQPGLVEFLLSVNWLKLYDSEHVLAGRWKFHEETIRKISKDYATRIQRMKELKIVWGGFEDDDIFLVSVDGTHCRIQEVRTDPDAKWFSHKFNGPALSYEVAIAIRSNRVVWVRGPFPASKHDISIFRSEDNPEQGLMAKIPEGKRAIGDSGFVGEPTKVSVTREGDTDEMKHFKARAKSRQETFNSRLKSFNILDSAFRHGFHQHQMVFEAVCVLVQYDMENGHPLFEV